MPSSSHPYDRLGLPPVINADARLTVLGGSRMPEDVRSAMAAAANRYVDMHELQRTVGDRIAELTGNDAAFVTVGAAAGLTLSVLACRTRGDLANVARLLEGPIGADGAGPDEVIIHRGHRIPYDPAVRLGGARLVEIGTALQTFDWELEAAITERTAAVLYVAGSHLARPVLPLEEVIAIAHARGVPVIVDAAAQLPPAENLWHFTVVQGADLAVFSGGKDLEGPQASGLVVGTRELVEAIRVNAPPHQRLVRAMKVGREEMVGLLAAVERYLRLDHDVRMASWERIVARWVAELGAIDGVEATRVFPNEAGQPHPRALLRLDEKILGFSGPGLRAALWVSNPRIAVAAEGSDAISMSPDPLADGEEEIVLECIRALLSTR